MEQNKKDGIVKLYKEVLGCYSSYITRKTDNAYLRLTQTIERARVLKTQLEKDNDTDSLVILSMWFIDGTGWLNLEPTEDQTSIAVTSCLRAMEAKGETMEFMNLDIQFVNPNMTVLDKNNVDEFCADLDAARDELDQAINKVKKEAKVNANNTDETKAEEVKTDETTEESSTETNETGDKAETGSKMEILKNVAKGFAIGLVAAIAVAGTIYGVRKYTDDGVTIVNFE